MNPEPQATNPYVGLRPFEQEDSLYFFGRREQTVELLEQLAETHFLAVVGSSGCGKSSLIRAGLIPALLGGFLVEERDVWQIAIMKPGDAPLRNLAVALCQAFDKAPGDTAIADLHETIIADHIQAVVSYLSLHLGTNTNVLLLIDQFEEIFSFRGTEEDEQTVQLSRPQRLERARRRAEADDFVDLMLGLKAYHPSFRLYRLDYAHGFPGRLRSVLWVARSDESVPLPGPAFDAATAPTGHRRPGPPFRDIPYPPSPGSPAQSTW